MIANTAFGAALTTFLVVAWLAGELSFLAPYKTALFARHGQLIVGGVLLLFVNLCAVYYGLARWLFVREAGHKLSYLDRQLTTADTGLDDLSADLPSE